MKKFLVSLVMGVTALCSNAAEFISDKFHSYPVYSVEVGSDADGGVAKINKTLEMAFKHAKTTDDMVEILQAADIPPQAIRGAVILKLMEKLPKEDQEAFNKIHQEALDTNTIYFKKHQMFFTWFIGVGVSFLILILVVAAAWAVTQHLKTVNANGGEGNVD